MRLSLVLVLALAVLTMNAAAQTYKKPRKPHSTQTQARSLPRAAKARPARDTTAQELHRAEQSSTKALAKKSHDKPVRNAGIVKGNKQDANPPIRVATAGKPSGVKNRQGSNPLKGRLKEKGAHR
jgi:hypothetical protein